MKRRSVGWIGLGLVLIGLTWWFVRRDQERSGLLELPAQQRATVYSETLEAFRAACSPASPKALTEHCRRQAEFLMKFPDCDDECRRLTAAAQQVPTR
jgi:hypothetical protein